MRDDIARFFAFLFSKSVGFLGPWPTAIILIILVIPFLASLFSNSDNKNAASDPDAMSIIDYIGRISFLVALIFGLFTFFSKQSENNELERNNNKDQIEVIEENNPSNNQ